MEVPAALKRHFTAAFNLTQSIHLLYDSMTPPAWRR
jgi:hypothetical protein